MAFASGQYFITQVNSELQKINQNIDKILEFLYGDKKAELLSEVSFVKYAYENFSSIMAHDEQRVATIASLQNAKTAKHSFFTLIDIRCHFPINILDKFSIIILRKICFQNSAHSI